MKSNYEKFIQVISLSRNYNSGLLRNEIDEMVKNLLSGYLLPDELYILYEKINGGNDFLFDSFYSLSEAIDKRDEYINLLRESWLKAWMPLGMDDTFDYIVVLSKEKRNSCEIYYIDLGGGDPNLYLYTTDIASLINLEMERYKILQDTETALSYRDLYLEFIPDAYPYFEEKRQKGIYSKNGIRNIYDILDLDSLPKEWF